MTGPSTMLRLAQRVLDHLDIGTTDSAPDVMRVPIDSYHDPDVWRRELDRVFHRVPLALSFSVELPEPLSYKTIDVAERPVLIVRGSDGVARAFLNVCRHRGARVCEERFGSARRMRCPYHAWVYDDHGALVSIYREETFGEVAKDELGLIELPAEERHGIVWVGLTPGTPLDLDRWLGEYGAELEALDFGSWHVHDQREIEGPGWKTAYDGYLEGYHGEFLHAETVAVGSVPNLMVVDGFGPHERIIFALRSVEALRGLPESEWDVAEHCVPTHTIFPNVSIAGAWHERAVACTILPGPTFDRSTTVQTVLTRTPPATRREVALARKFTATMVQVHRDEDYPTGFGIQSAMASGANDHFLLGRNELAVQHFHRWIDRLVGEPWGS